MNSFIINSLHSEMRKLGYLQTTVIISMIYPLYGNSYL